MKSIKFTDSELKFIYQLIKSFEEEMVQNPSESWEMDYYDEPLIDRKPLKSILKKVEKSLPKNKKEEILKSFLRRKYSTFNNEIDEKVYSILEKAFMQLKTVEIKYFNTESAEFSKRKIDIYYKSRKHIIAYCHLRKSIRKFRTSRIAYAKLTDEKYKIPDDFDKNKY
ncbi:MAG: WYL domain-containing protein [Candidatus Pacearchaeota archaeon]|nr:WYL domain-containing protein [Candidatus Pacearchaeota archaeon]